MALSKIKFSGVDPFNHQCLGSLIRKSKVRLHMMIQGRNPWLNRPKTSYPENKFEEDPIFLWIGIFCMSSVRTI